MREQDEGGDETLCAGGVLAYHMIQATPQGPF